MIIKGTDIRTIDVRHSLSDLIIDIKDNKIPKELNSSSFTFGMFKITEKDLLKILDKFEYKLIKKKMNVHLKPIFKDD